MKTKKSSKHFFLWLAVLLILWEIASQIEIVNAHLLPPFSDVFINLLKELFVGGLGIKVLSSIQIILVGFILSLVLAIVIIMICVWIPVAESLFTMLSTILNPLPSVALMPLIIMWFGINTGAMMALIMHAVLWSLLRHLLDGMHSIPLVYREWGKNINLSPWRMFIDITFYAILPEFLAGARVSWGRAWRALLSAELVIGAVGGLGFYINMARAHANIENVMSGLVVIIIIGILIEKLFFGQIEKRTVVKWGMTHE